MAAITYGAGAPAATTAKAPAAAPAKSIWLRLWDAFIEARMQQAMREVALHRHLLPAELETKFGRGTAKTNP
jgi:hypothetical protein